VGFHPVAVALQNDTQIKHNTKIKYITYRIQITYTSNINTTQNTTLKKKKRKESKKRNVTKKNCALRMPDVSEERVTSILSQENPSRRKSSECSSGPEMTLKMEVITFYRNVGLHKDYMAQYPR
jgi:hypothetical protein